MQYKYNINGKNNSSKKKKMFWNLKTLAVFYFEKVTAILVSWPQLCTYPDNVLSLIRFSRNYFIFLNTIFVRNYCK
jgi:hypothetical protein